MEGQPLIIDWRALKAGFLSPFPLLVLCQSLGLPTCVMMVISESCNQLIPTYLVFQLADSHETFAQITLCSLSDHVQSDTFQA